MINQCLMYRYIISYEPYNFKGHLDDYPATMIYGKKMDALRTEFREYFWDGEFRHEVGATVTCDGKPHHPYAVFNGTNGRPGIVICNYDDNKAITVQATVDRADVGQMQYRLVDNPAWRNMSDGITISARSAVVIIEK